MIMMSFVCLSSLSVVFWSRVVPFIGTRCFGISDFHLLHRPAACMMTLGFTLVSSLRLSYLSRVGSGWRLRAPFRYLSYPHWPLPIGLLDNTWLYFISLSTDSLFYFGHVLHDGV